MHVMCRDFVVVASGNGNCLEAIAYLTRYRMRRELPWGSSPGASIAPATKQSSVSLQGFFVNQVRKTIMFYFDFLNQMLSENICLCLYVIHIYINMYLYFLFTTDSPRNNTYFVYVPFKHVFELVWGLRAPLGQEGVFSFEKMNNSRDVCLNKFQYILILSSTGVLNKTPVGNYSLPISENRVPLI